jgi:excisionase family DNA binding protein
MMIMPGLIVKSDVVPLMYRVDEAAAALRLSRSSVYELIRSGQLRTVKQGRRRLVPVTALAEYVASLGVTRRAKGDGGLSWDAARERWVASATTGYDGRHKRIVRRGRGRTKTEAKNKLRQLLRDLEDGLVVANDGYTVAQAVEDWLTYGLSNGDPATQEVNRRLWEKHVIPRLGARKLRDLKATEVDAWLTDLSTTLSTRTLQAIRSCLNRAVKRAMARDRVRRNVVELTEPPTEQSGRPSKALSAQQADDVLIKTSVDRLHPYIVVSLLTGARTEELRALR